jgi:sulfur-carrier protein adenylyltransferase/sulfurtransferase
MSKRYIILSCILLLAGVGLVILPGKLKTKELDPEQLLLAVDDPGRFVSTDLITDRIIKKDPGLVMIDVRPAGQFKVFALAGAINIPFDSLPGAAALAVLNEEGKDKVFYSNDDVLADQAWLLCKRQKIRDIFVLKGGLNNWFATIMQDNPPGPADDSRAHDLYSFRKAARQYFMGENAPMSSSDQKGSSEKGKKEAVKVEKKAPHKSSGGGC